MSEPFVKYEVGWHYETIPCLRVFHVCKEGDALRQAEFRDGQFICTHCHEVWDREQTPSPQPFAKWRIVFTNPSTAAECHIYVDDKELTGVHVLGLHAEVGDIVHLELGVYPGAIEVEGIATADAPIVVRPMERAYDDMTCLGDGWRIRKAKKVQPDA